MRPGPSPIMNSGLVDCEALEIGSIWDRNSFRRPENIRQVPGCSVPVRGTVILFMQYDPRSTSGFKKPRENSLKFTKINVDCGEKVKHVNVRSPIQRRFGSP